MTPVAVALCIGLPLLAAFVALLVAIEERPVHQPSPMISDDVLGVNRP